jgi:hypothetical protein
MKEECMTGAWQEKVTQKNSFGLMRLMFLSFKKEILHHRYFVLNTFSVS